MNNNLITTLCALPIGGLPLHAKNIRLTEQEAALNGTYYALAPFIGALLSIFILGEPITLTFVVASLIMASGCWLAAI